MKNDAEATIVAHKVNDPSRFGVIVTKTGTSLVDHFVEKPQEFVGDNINAGIYIFNYSALNFIELRNYSLEKEFFPKLASENLLSVY